MIRRLPFILILVALLVPGLLLAGCSGQGQNGAANTNGIKMAPMSDMPAEVKEASATTQQAYQFAVANPDVLQQIPCYCGCGAMGHTSNYACYVKSTENGKVTFDQHALGCSICVDITQDTMRLMKEGKSTAEIKQIIDQTYGKYGPSNME